MREKRNYDTLEIECCFFPEIEDVITASDGDNFRSDDNDKNFGEINW